MEAPWNQRRATEAPPSATWTAIRKSPPLRQKIKLFRGQNNVINHPTFDAKDTTYKNGECLDCFVALF